MSGKTEFVIPFSGLKEGTYEFDKQLGDEFFESLDVPEFNKGQLDVHVVMERRQHMLTLEITMKGHVNMECDRCGNPFEQPVDTANKMVVNLNAEQFEDEDDLISLPAHYHELDLTQYLYQYIMLSLPLRKVCPPTPGCDPEVIKKLDELIVQEQEDQAEEEEEKQHDPRWDALLKLKNNN